jgi:hypothetical protein
VVSASGKSVWVGRVISVLASLVFLMSAFMKLKGGPELAQGMAHQGLPAFFIQIALGILVWLGLYLREPRLKDLIPLRRS